MYYYQFQSPRAATILWGRLPTCGGLLIRLPLAMKHLQSLRLAAMWGRLPKPAADWQSARRETRNCLAAAPPFGAAKRMRLSH